MLSLIDWAKQRLHVGDYVVSGGLYLFQITEVSSVDMVKISQVADIINQTVYWKIPKNAGCYRIFHFKRVEVRENKICYLS